MAMKAMEFCGGVDVNEVARGILLPPFGPRG